MDFAEKIKTIWFIKSSKLERKNEDTIQHTIEYNENLKKERENKTLENIQEKTNEYMWHKNNAS